MNTNEFIDLIEDDYDIKIVAVTCDSAILEIRVEYDSFLLPTDAARSATIKCINPIEWNIYPGYAGSMSYSDEHPLLLNHSNQQAQLFFSSPPASPAEVFFIAHKVLNNELSGWRNPSEYLNGHPEELLSHLVGGYGLLARGPHKVMNALAQALEQQLFLNLIPSTANSNSFVALTLGEHFVICQSAEIFIDAT